MSRTRKKETALAGAAPMTNDTLSTREPERRHKCSEGGPWCWQRKGARRKIRIACDGDSIRVYALSVYDALSELASDQQSEVVRAGQPRIGEYAGCGVSQVKKCLTLLEKIGLLKITSKKLKEWNEYTLLEVDSDSRITTNDSHGAKNEAVAIVSHGANNRAVATVEECIEESLEESLEEDGTKSSEKIVCRPGASRPEAGSPISFSEEVDSLIRLWPRNDGNSSQQKEIVGAAVKEVGYPQLKERVSLWATEYLRRKREDKLKPQHVPGIVKFFGEKRYENEVSSKSSDRPVVNLRPDQTWGKK